MNEPVKSAVPRRQTFVQTQREAHLQWGKLAVKKPAAAAVLHQLVALMDRKNAIGISHSVLAKLVGINERSVRRSIDYLIENRWVQAVRLGKRGTVNVYVVNSRVAWADRRDNLKLAVFDARIVADADDQDAITLEPRDMKVVPIIHPPEVALPTGEWPKDEQGQLPGMETVAEGWPEYED